MTQVKQTSFKVGEVAVLLSVTLIAFPLIIWSVKEPISTLQVQLLKETATIAGIAASLCFVISSFSRNYSQVDKLWSIIPIVYVWYVPLQAGTTPRLLLMASLVTLWGIRLTYNFNRRGGYSWKFWTGEEDYRWGVLRKSPAFNKPWKWTLFNLFFISMYQMALIWMFCLPVVAVAGYNQPLTAGDFLLSILFISFLLIETIADQQQWNFQKQKYVRMGTPLFVPPYSLGFTHHGLWAYMRHPNYMAEQAIWLTFYGFSVVATVNWFHWSAAGSLLLLLLFQGSARFSEQISSGKYPEYSNYIQKTGRFLPIKRGYKPAQ